MHEGWLSLGGLTVISDEAAAALGDNAACRGFFEQHATRRLRIAERLGIIAEVETDATAQHGTTDPPDAEAGRTTDGQADRVTAGDGPQHSCGRLPADG